MKKQKQSPVVSLSKLDVPGPVKAALIDYLAEEKDEARIQEVMDLVRDYEAASKAEDEGFIALLEEIHGRYVEQQQALAQKINRSLAKMARAKKDEAQRKKGVADLRKAIRNMK
jgi:hypothetical protein